MPPTSGWWLTRRVSDPNPVLIPPRCLRQHQPYAGVFWHWLLLMVTMVGGSAVTYWLGPLSRVDEAVAFAVLTDTLRGTLP